MRNEPIGGTSRRHHLRQLHRDLGSIRRFERSDPRRYYFRNHGTEDYFTETETSTDRPASGPLGARLVDGGPLMAALDLLGRRWALRVLWELRDGPLGARALRERCDDMSPSVLYERLASSKKLDSSPSATTSDIS